MIITTIYRSDTGYFTQLEFDELVYLCLEFSEALSEVNTVIVDLVTNSECFALVGLYDWLASLGVVDFKREVMDVNSI